VKTVGPLSENLQSEIDLGRAKGLHTVSSCAKFDCSKG
jgi:hypothetical protein